MALKKPVISSLKFARISFTCRRLYMNDRIIKSSYVEDNIQQGKWMSVILPPQLKSGDKIGFFSPSSPATTFAKVRFDRAKAFLENKGFELVAGNLTGKSDFYRSGSIKARAEELNTLIRNAEIKCIISTIGGYNSNALLPYLDYEALIKKPKIIMGYSDVTALLLGIYTKTGLMTFYGPALVASFGEFPPLVE